MALRWNRWVPALACLVAAGIGTPANAARVSGRPVTGAQAVAGPAPRALVPLGSLGLMAPDVLDREAAVEAGREGQVRGPGAEEGGRNKDKKPNPAASKARPAPNKPRRSGLRTAVSPSGGFDGTGATDWHPFPPDTQGAAGPAQYIVALNGRLRSYAKATGTADGALDISPREFFASVMTPLVAPVTSNFTSDPHIRYDRLSHRWFVLIIDVPNGGALSNRFLLAVSDGPVITSSTVWSRFFWREDLGTADGQFADYPTLGIDQNALYVGANMFDATTSQYTGTRAYVVRKSSVLAGGPIVVTKFRTGDDKSGLFTPQGVDDRSGSSPVGWFAGVDQGTFGRLDLLRVNNPGGTPTLSGLTSSSGPAPAFTPTLAVTVPATAYPVPVPHKGNTGGDSGRLDAIDDRLYSATLRDGHIWTAQAVGVTSTGVASASSASRDAARWYELDVSGTAPSLGQSGAVFDDAATSPRSYWVPTVNVNGQGNMAMGGSVAGTADYANAFFTGRLAADAAGTTEAPALATAASAAYNPPGDPGTAAAHRRWGDYSLISVDPEDDQTMWSIQEYTASADVYGTRITRLLAPAPAVSAAFPLSVDAGPSVTHVTITGTGFFDPGASFPKRLAVTSTCGAGITVTGVSPTQVTADVVAPSAGPCGFTVINPDGQTSGSTGGGDPPVATPDTASTPPSTTATTPPSTTPPGTMTPTPTPTATAPVGVPRPCRVPTVKYLTLRRAKAKVRRAHCAVGKTRYVRTTKVRRGRVLSSSPRAGSVVKVGRRVVLNARR